MLTMHRQSLFPALLLLAALACTACGSTAVTRAPATIEIQEAVGFTIFEEANIGSDVRADYDRALVLLQHGQLDEGIELLESVAGSAPELSAPRIDLGIAYHRLNDLEAAERNLLEALDVNPRHPIALNELGIVYRKTGRFAEARQRYEAALDVYPGFHFARRNLAVLCDIYLADLQCALRNYEAYMATVHSDEEASMWVRDLRYRIDQED
jgi:tetratricopeptide (TPR) repeat protein